MTPAFRRLPAGLAVLALVAPWQPAAAADAAAGKARAKQCAVCHGIDGVAKIPIAPHIAGESSVYLETQLKAFRSGKRVHEIMSVIAQDLTDQEIADLAAWYSSIKFEVTLPE
ncbi:MAG: cytochrome c [Thermohalobaculum sp.]|nr:cytochrome c [Thermohalobaculum sp.]